MRVPTPMRPMRPREDTVIGGGKYFIDANTTVVVNGWTVMRDPKVWGDDVRGKNFCLVFLTM